MTDGSIEHSGRVGGWRRASFPNLPPVVVSSRWPDGQAREEGLHVIVDGKRPRSCRLLSSSPMERKVYGERSALERGHVRFLSEAPGEEVYGERLA